LIEIVTLEIVLDVLDSTELHKILLITNIVLLVAAESYYMYGEVSIVGVSSASPFNAQDAKVDVTVSHCWQENSSAYACMYTMRTDTL